RHLPPRGHSQTRSDVITVHAVRFPKTMPAYDIPPPPCAVAITAAGIISPLGCGLAETLESLRAGRDCVTPVSRFDVTKCRSKAAGQVSDCGLRIADCGLSGRKAARLHRASRMMIA